MNVPDRLTQANLQFAQTYPGETSLRQPVHTVYGGAHLFQSNVSERLGSLALRSLEQHAPTAQVFADALRLPSPEHLAEAIYSRVLEKLHREPVEDFRLDLEDGYGNRPDQEEDGHAASAAREVAKGMASRSLP